MFPGEKQALILSKATRINGLPANINNLIDAVEIPGQVRSSDSIYYVSFFLFFLNSKNMLLISKMSVDHNANVTNRICACAVEIEDLVRDLNSICVFVMSYFCFE